MIARLLRSLPRALAAAAAVLALCDCSTLRHVFHTGDNTNKQAEQLQILQLRNQRFADEYVGSIIQPIRQFQASTGNAVDRLDSQDWMLSQATAAYTIASGPSPVLNVADMVVLATLSRMVIDEAWVGERFGDRAAALRDAYHRLEPQALELANGVLPADQIAALQRAIIEWRAQNPHVTAISFVHFRDVAASMGRPTGGGSDSFSGLFTMLGLDPFSSLDPAVREITQSRELAERTIYYAQRVPNLLDMQVERLAFQFATMPETKQLLADADSVSGAAGIAGRVINEFPGILAGEREAAIRQFMESINVETAKLRELTIDVRSALEAGTATSNSLNTTIRSFNQLVAGFEKPPPAGQPAQSPGRPFDITEYTAAAAEITRAATQLQQLIAGIDQSSPALVQTADHATATLREVVDHAYWRSVQLIGLLLLGGLGVALVYRGVARRWLA
jgi:hypothetical protein